MFFFKKKEEEELPSQRLKKLEVRVSYLESEFTALSIENDHLRHKILAKITAKRGPNSAESGENATNLYNSVLIPTP